ncbi:2-dehydropantoate 2-reductase N-terminal domain-containing protein [Solwaraspora sp. WMMD1047]|uniref:ketopantoate reductase family protein n=1 Tax=Solwaraspora sp. WMMD1047 TaxID=3016102 RepID=UPI002415F171|nr:2-dehydropantoate 2-reductase N-terminal domain-containing protein [Solwaraspora sp. WMMD1047]MDG4833312.1 2-dehydropantoate 2-reductase N-terminal domain-containing protein [Solwaraspora sp. WMMD1047]
MRYVIIGAGAVGGTIGVRLSQAGHDVTLVARGAHLAAIQERGLTLAAPDGEYTARLPAVADPAGLTLEPDTALVLAVKSQDTDAALATWADTPVRGGGTAAQRLPLLTAQNGVSNEPAALRFFAHVIGVCVWLPAVFLRPGEIEANAAPYTGILHLGRYPEGPADDRVHKISAELAASSFLAPVRVDVLRWKYGKLLRNLNNGPQALFGDAVDPELSRRISAEGMAVLDAAGIAYASEAEDRAERGDRMRHRPIAGRERSGNSTWQSLARGAGSVETDHLNGEIVLLGRQHGVPTPVNEAVQRAVRRAVRDRIPAGEFPRSELLPDLTDG